MTQTPSRARRAPPSGPRESTLKTAIRKALGAYPDKVVTWLHLGGAIVMRVRCPNPKCNQVFGVHDHAVGARLDAGLGTGTGDLIGLTGGGRFLQIEVKRPGEDEWGGQPERRRLINKLGGYACVVTSVAEAEEHAETARLGEQAPVRPLDPEGSPLPTPSEGWVERQRAGFWKASCDRLVAVVDGDTVRLQRAEEQREEARQALASWGVSP